MRRFLNRLINLFRGPHADGEMSREMQSHLALLQEDFEKRGLTPDEARREARRSYGGLEQAKELHRETRSFQWVEHLSKDIRYGTRNLLRTPGFTAVAVLTLALGIGANTAIFSVVNAVLLRPLAYQDPGRLVTVLHYGSGPVAPGSFIDWRVQNTSFEAMEAAQFWRPNVSNSDPPEQVLGLHLTPGMFAMLGVQPALGRWFATKANAKVAEHEIVLSDGLWTRRYGRDPKVLWKRMTLNGESFTIIGVMPPDFKFAPFWATRAEMWAPETFASRVQDREGRSLRVFARLKPGVTVAQAQADINAIAARIEEKYPGASRGARVTPLKENVTGKVETPLWIVLGAAAFLLSIACANVAHMMLARTSDRQKEIAVRTALGATRNRLLGQFLTESLLLASLGAAAGVMLAFWGTKALVALSPAYIPRVETVGIDHQVVVFLFGVTALTAIAFGLAPAMRAAAANLSGALKEGGRGGTDSARRGRLRSVLVASEFALAFMLLIGAGLMIRSFYALQAVDPGFDPHNVVSMTVSVTGSPEGLPDRRPLFYRQLVEHVRTLPGVVSAAGINHLPIAGDLWTRSFIFEGRPEPRRGEEPNGVYRLVTPGYFETMRLPLLAGRDVSVNDDATGAGVVVINESAAKDYWPNENPIGKRFRFKSENGEVQPRITVIGVVKNAKQLDWAERIWDEFYFAAAQHDAGRLEDPGDHLDYVTLVVRARSDAAAIAPEIKKAVWSFDHNLPISNILTMERVVEEATAQQRFEMLLFGVFGAVALALAAAGIYGVMNYAVSRRTHEIGIRMSLGASRSDVLKLVVGQGIRQAIAGTAAGCAGALLLSRLMSKMLYGVRPTDPFTFGGVLVALGCAALIATLVPARKAACVEPAIALRND